MFFVMISLPIVIRLLCKRCLSTLNADAQILTHKLDRGGTLKRISTLVPTQLCDDLVPSGATHLFTFCVPVEMIEP